jgi:hypothetical protein
MVVLICFRSRRLFLRLGRLPWRRNGNRCRRLGGLRKRRRWFREVGNGSSAEVREVRNGLETIGDGSQNYEIGKKKRKDAMETYPDMS